jgi:6-phosphogluconolactonase
MKSLKSTLLSALVLIAFTASLRAELLYVSYGKGLLSFAINPNTGALTKLPDTPTLFAEGIGSITLDHTGKLLYASTGGNVVESGYSYGPYSSIHGYRIAGNGKLIPLPGSPYKVAGGYLAVDPFNRFLYAADYGTYPNPGSVAVYRIHSNGSLAPVPGSPFKAGVGAYQIAVDPFGRFIYVVNFNSRNTSVFQVQANGALTSVPGSPFETTDPISVVADPNGRFIYVTNENFANIIAYRVAPNGNLIALNSPPPSGAPWYENSAIDPFGRFLYVDEGTSGFLAFRLDPTTGLPTTSLSISGPPLGGMQDNNPVGVCASPSGKFVYVGNANGIVDPGPMTIWGFKVSSTGILTQTPGTPYYPLGNNGVGEDDPLVVATEGYPSSMVVAHQYSQKDDD